MTTFQLLFLTCSFLGFGKKENPEIYSYTKKYVEIVQVELKHEFFEDGKLKDFQIEPDGATAAMLKQYDLHYRQDGNFLRIYAPDTLNLSEVVFNSDFRFDCTSGDPTFYNYTGDYNFKGWDSFNPQKDRLIFSNEPNDGSPIELISEIVEAPKDEVNSRISFSLWLDFNGLKPESPENPIHYLLQFKSRLVSHKYYFMNRTDMNIQGIQLTGGMDDLYKFNGTSTEFGNGEKAYILESGNNLFPLKERCENLNAVITSNKHSGELISQTLSLPCPNATSLRYDDQAHRYYVEVYIYL